MLTNKKPEPLIALGPRTPAEWIAAGDVVFHELDFPGARSYDPRYFGILRSPEEFKKMGVHAQKDGVVLGLRLVPTNRGLAVSVQQCANCHVRVMPDGSLLDGAPTNDPGDQIAAELFSVLDSFPGESPAMFNWRSFAVPWIPNDIHTAIRTMPQKELDELMDSNIEGTFPRFNGSPYFTTKMPDLIGVGERKYIDATATHRNRVPEDIARYAALVSCCDSADFGSYRMLTDQQRVLAGRYPDELLYALAQYVVSLQPPKNPNLGDARAVLGKTVFEREGCTGCHAPPLYTNNKLTLAQGYRPPTDHPLAADILSLAVGTDPNLALKTRKGTGLYKIPSLKGVWYRGLYGHDGSVASLEDWFNPARLRDDYVPTGFKGYKVEHRSVSGHEFGLKLAPGDKAALIAFLRTL
jgi:hypothetical protein